MTDLIAPYVCQADAKQWVRDVRRLRYTYTKQYVIKKIKSILQGSAVLRLQPQIKQEYEDGWSVLQFDRFSPHYAAKKFSPWVWQDQKMLMAASGGARARLYLLMQVIEFLKPKKILEIGCGAGLNLMVLACRFPDIEFYGLELTKAGLDQIRQVQQEEMLPQSLQEFSPEPLLDLAGHQRLKLFQGSAGDLPFEDKEFDLSFSCLALEQMESLRDQALSEFSRVTREYAVMIEPFYDTNATGVARKRMVVLDYFQGKIDDLIQYGMNPLYISDDLPGKVLLRPALVVSKMA